MAQSIITLFKTKPVRWALAISWTIFICVLLVQPGEHKIINTGIPEAPPSVEREIMFTIAHIITFSITCAIWFWTWFGHLNIKKSLLIAVITVVVLGIVTEYLQAYAPDRNPSVIDLAANCVGALLIAFVIWRNQHHITKLPII